MAQSTYSLLFDHAVSNQRVTVPANASYAISRSHSFWIKRTSNNTGTVMDKSDGNLSSGEFSVEINTGANGSLVYRREFASLNASVTTSTTFPINTWTHVLITWDGTADLNNVHIYFNGVECSYSQKGIGSGITDGTRDLYIGAGHSGFSGTVPFDGMLDDIAFFSSELAITDAVFLYGDGSAGSAGNPATLSPTLLLRAEEGTGTSTSDSSGNSNTGTLTSGVAWSSDVPSALAGGGGSPIIVTPGVASLTLTKYAPTILTPIVVTPPTKALALTGFAPAVLLPKVVTPPTKNLTLTEFAPLVLTPRVVIPGTRSFTITSFSPTIVIGNQQTPTPGTANLLITSYPPIILTPRLVTPGVKNLTISTFPPVIVTPKVVVPGIKALTLSMFAPVIQTPRIVTPGVKSLTLSAFAPQVLVPKVVIPSTKNLVLTKYAPTILTPVVITPNYQQLILTKYAPIILTPRIVTPGTTNLHLTRFAPVVTGGGGGVAFDVSGFFFSSG